jgi:hypothetical protein
MGGNVKVVETCSDPEGIVVDGAVVDWANSGARGRELHADATSATASAVAASFVEMRMAQR